MLSVISKRVELSFSLYFDFKCPVIYISAFPSPYSLRSTSSWTWGHGHADQRPKWTTAFPEPSSGPVEPMQVLQHRAETQQARRALQT